MEAPISKPVLTARPDGGRDPKKFKPICVLCDDECETSDELKNRTSWANLKLHAEKWSGLDRYGDVYDRVSWENGPEGCFAHKRCKTYITIERTLLQAKKRQELAARTNHESAAHISTSSDAEPSNRPGAGRRNTGAINSPNLCIFCLQPRDDRHQGRRRSQLHLIVEVTYLFM